MDSFTFTSNYTTRCSEEVAAVIEFMDRNVFIINLHTSNIPNILLLLNAENVGLAQIFVLISNSQAAEACGSGVWKTT
jgi:hypothetical protein